jgi:hypothetical protein
VSDDAVLLDAIDRWLDKEVQPQVMQLSFKKSLVCYFCCLNCLV